MIPDLSVFVVVVVVLLLTGILDRLLFKPITRVMHERQGRVASARELAEQASKRAASALTELEEKTAAARAEVYGEMDEARRGALKYRADVVNATRAEAESAVAEAIDQLETAKTEARDALTREADALSAAAAERILGRKVS